MSTGSMITLAVIVFFLFYLVLIYNRLVYLRNAFKTAFSGIQVQLTRRYELIPNLVETAKKYMAHEKETLTNVIAARNQAVNASESAAQHPEDPEAIKSLMGAETMLSGALGKLFALSENYPDLKANQNMMQLMDELTNTENRVSYSRQEFNDAVMNYNTYREQFPNMFIANPFGFMPAQLFEMSKPEYNEPIKVSFD